jgi:hypothetical protein
MVTENLVGSYRRTTTIGFDCKSGHSEGSKFREFWIYRQLLEIAHMVDG